MRVRNAIGTVVIAAAIASCGGGSDTGTGPGPGDGPSTSTSIDVRDNAFSPVATTVPVGSTVTWTWRGSNAHDVSFAATETSGARTSGSYSRLFTAAGTYDYICTIHGSAMSGRVVVQ